ncbi:hypothetical protein L3Q82_011160, partial [Scortum barcoo]
PEKDRPQSVRIHDVSSSSISLSTGSPQGCVLSPLLFTLLTHDCSAIHPSCLIVKFADDTAVVGRIANNDESDYRQEVEHLEGWCRQNNLCINVKKTKEMIVDFRRGRHLPLPCTSEGLRWKWSPASGTSASLLPQEAEARRAGELSPDLLLQMCGGERPVLLHHRVARQLLGGREEGSLQRVVKAAQRTVGRSLPTTTDIYTFQMQETGLLHHEGPHSHTAHELFVVPLPSGRRRLRSIKSRTTRLRNSFFPEAVRLLNSGGPL